MNNISSKQAFHKWSFQKQLSLALNVSFHMQHQMIINFTYVQKR